MHRESKFQSDLVKDLRSMFPDCIILKGNANYLQGIPDLLVLWGPCYAFLEVKRSADEDRQPNQEWYVDLLNDWSFSAFIHPENKEEILDALQRSFQAGR